MILDWHRATDVASSIAARWTAERGPGGAILLFDADDIRAEACGGLASLEFGLPFTADTTTRYASISKHFMGALLLRLQEEGMLRLDDALGAHLSDLAPAVRAVTLGRALDMTSGLPDVMETQWLLGVPWTASIDRAAALAFAREIGALNYPTGSEMSYTNTGYRLVEAALAAKGRSVSTLLRERFFRPLGLTIRLAEDEAEPIPGLATGYWRTDGDWRRGRYGLQFSPSGGLAGTARDLVTWLQALMAGRTPAKGLFPQLGARRHLVDGTSTGYGLGLARALFPGEIAIGHGGSLPGYKNEFILIPGHMAGIVVLSNREDTAAARFATSVLAALTGVTLPAHAADDLPSGLFVTEEGPFWLEHDSGMLTFLGAATELYCGENGAVVSGSAHYPIRLRSEGGAITGEIGHVARRFTSVVAGAALSPEMAGTWRCTTQDMRFTISAAADVWRMTSGAGPLYDARRLQVLDARRALVTRTDGPWRQRACLALDPDGSLRVVSHRSRALRFIRE